MTLASTDPRSKSSGSPASVHYDHKEVCFHQSSGLDSVGVAGWSRKPRALVGQGAQVRREVMGVSPYLLYRFQKAWVMSLDWKPSMLGNHTATPSLGGFPIYLLSLECIGSTSWRPDVPLSWMRSALRKGGRPRKLTLSDRVQVECWVPSMGMTMVCLCPMSLDPMVGHPGDVWNLLLTSSASCAPSPLLCPPPSPDRPLSLWSTCQGLSVLDFAPEPDARLGCGPGGPSLKGGQRLAVGLRPSAVSRESRHRWRRLMGTA